MVCCKVVCKIACKRRRSGGGGGRDTEPKTRTPHKDVGKTHTQFPETMLFAFPTKTTYIYIQLLYIYIYIYIFKNYFFLCFSMAPKLDGQNPWGFQSPQHPHVAAPARDASQVCRPSCDSSFAPKWISSSSVILAAKNSLVHKV